jgi:hypothetical protein
VADAEVDSIVDAVSDGEDVDWASVRHRCTNPESAGVVTQLHTISKISRAGRREGFERLEPHDSRLVSCAWLYATLQIVVGIVGTVAYREHSLLNALRLLSICSFGAVAIALRRARGNPRAHDLGAIFLFTALQFSRNGYIRLLDAPLASSWVVRLLQSGVPLDALTPFFMWSFVRRFPATLRFTRIDRLALVLVKASLGVGMVLIAANVWTALTGARSGPAWQLALAREEGQRFSAIVYVLTLAAFPVMLSRARSALPDERARVRLFTLSFVMSSFPALVEVTLEAFIPAYTAFLRATPTALTAMVLATLVPLLSIPFITGYSVLVHQLLDVRVVIQLGFRYLLTRYTLGGLTITPFGLLALHVYSHRNESLATLVSGGRGALLASLGLVGVFMLGVRPFLAALIDRWFDRRNADRASVLARTSESLRLARTRSEIVATIADASSSGLNANAFVHFLDPRRNAYVPFGAAGGALPAESAIGAIVMQEQGFHMLRTDREHSIVRFLPRAERVWVEQLNAWAMTTIPSSTGVGRPTGLIAFGPRRDAVGFSRDDERFIAALAAAAGIALENLRLRGDAAGADETATDLGVLCLRCGMVDDAVEGRRFCVCGGNLQPAAVARNINGKFRLDALLGSGGMGVVYLATDLSLGRPVAIKTLPSVSAQAFVRLGQEARTMASLSHVNLATILGTETWRGTPILVCEYLAGGTLQKRLAAAPLTLRESLALGTTLLGALEYMHGAGVLHRDIKPSNIGFAADGSPKLLDFGLAGLIERPLGDAQAWDVRHIAALASGLAGTIGYLPPEAFNGEAPGPAFDLWALNVVMLECVLGGHPFGVGREVVQNIQRGRVVITPDVPAAAMGYFRDALSVDERKRPGTTTAVREAIASLRAAIHER